MNSYYPIQPEDPINIEIQINHEIQRKQDENKSRYSKASKDP